MATLTTHNPQPLTEDAPLHNFKVVVTALEATIAAHTTCGTAVYATATEATTTPVATTVILQKAANERHQQLTAAEYQKTTIEQLEHISAIGSDD